MVPGTRADLAEADWVSDELKNNPHVTLGCGHLSRPGSGPLAGAGFGYCRQHGVTRIVPEPRPGNGAMADEKKATARSAPPDPRGKNLAGDARPSAPPPGQRAVPPGPVHPGGPPPR